MEKVVNSPRNRQLCNTSLTNGELLPPVAVYVAGREEAGTVNTKTRGSVYSKGRSSRQVVFRIE